MAGERALTTTWPRWQATANDESVPIKMRAMTKMARAARAKVTTKRVPSNKEGKGGKGHGIGNKGGVQQRGAMMATEAREMATRVAGKRQQQGQWQR